MLDTNISKEKHSEAECGCVRMSQKCSPLALFSSKGTSCSIHNISHWHSTIFISSPLHGKASARGSHFSRQTSGHTDKIHREH